MAGSGRAPANPPVPRPTAGTMVPIDQMQAELGPYFDEQIAAPPVLGVDDDGEPILGPAGYYHAWGTGNRRWRRKVAAMARTWRGTQQELEDLLEIEFAYFLAGGA